MSEYTIGEETVTVEERNPSREEATGDSASATLEYVVSGTATSSSVKSAVKQEAPETYEGLRRGDMKLETTSLTTVWYVSVRYGKRATDSGGSTSLSDLSFDTGRESIRLHQALVPTPAAKRFAKAGETAPDDKGVIGWDGERAQGVEIGSGAFRFEVKRRFTDDEVDGAYILKLSRNAYKYNDATFWQWSSGEVLFEGATGGRTGASVIVETGDSEEQLSGYENMTGVTTSNTDDGKLYIKITKLVGASNYDIDFYKDAAMTSRVARVATGVVGSNTVAEDNSSGIGGTITLDQYVEDTDTIVAEFPFPWEITLKFAVSENLTSQTVGEIPTVSKLGWEYLDVVMADEEETVGSVQMVTRRPKFAYARQVYKDYDFDELNAGDDPFA